MPYHVVDVFTDRRYAGNPLAVVLDADELPAASLQAIAAEFHLSETVFPMRSDRASYRARIFTPATELPFAGHPSVGAAHTLVRLGRLPAGLVVQECGAGLLPIEVDAAGATLSGAAAEVGPDVDPAPYLAAIGLAAGDLADLPARTTSAGLPTLFLPVRADAVGRARLELAALAATGLADSLAVVAWEAATRTAHARVFAAAHGVPEDPATGSAALAFGVYLASAGMVGEGTSGYTIRQGAELGRPSTLTGTVTICDGGVVGVTIHGAVAPVASGELIAP
ncbi:MAG: PhzF family phenazine biosynthesis protein [Actinobacteria bacterium]|nr:PhzF family phenazine biosynthesis protein [Actinomycetota bacterium]MBI3687962.1 PhzF family phenazine biosynthesis protein [Actinomycetota bacterium]